MKNVVFALAILLFILPSVSSAAALTQQQSNSLIAVVQSSPGTPASAFVSLITAFSNITVNQATSLITVVQASPSAPANAFVNLLTSFTDDTITVQPATPAPDNSSAIQAEVQRQVEAFFKAKQEQDALVAQQKAESELRIDTQTQQAQEKLEGENKLVANIESQITSYLQKLETQISEVKQKIAIDQAIARSAASSASKSTAVCKGTQTSGGCELNRTTISYNVGSAVNGGILAQLAERRNTLNAIQSKLKESGSNGITENDKTFLTSIGISW